jgi:hypothetical protein
LRKTKSFIKSTGYRNLANKNQETPVKSPEFPEFCLEYFWPTPDNDFGAGSFTVRGQMTRYETDYHEVSHLFPFGIEHGPGIGESA